jgi:hypothetical protein
MLDKALDQSGNLNMSEFFFPGCPAHTLSGSGEVPSLLPLHISVPSSPQSEIWMVSNGPPILTHMESLMTSWNVDGLILEDHLLKIQMKHSQQYSE